MQKHRHQGESHVKMEAEIGVMHLYTSYGPPRIASNYQMLGHRSRFFLRTSETGTNSLTPDFGHVVSRTRTE